MFEIDKSDIPADEVPAGFVVGRDRFGDTVIHYRRTGMIAMNIFLTVWLTGWTFGCIFLLKQYLNGSLANDGKPMPLWFVSVFWIAEIGVAGMWLNMLFGKKSFHLSQSSLVRNTEIFGFRRSRTIARNSIKSFRQIKDGGEDEDSFPSWGLKIIADKKISLIGRQQYDKSHWLGKFLADWADVDFIEAPPE